LLGYLTVVLLGYLCFFAPASFVGSVASPSLNPTAAHMLGPTSCLVQSSKYNGGLQQCHACIPSRRLSVKPAEMGLDISSPPANSARIGIVSDC
jgi:hypothetical protein